MAGTSGADATPNRVPVDAAAARSLDIRLATVGRDSLSEIVRAVATIVPAALASEAQLESNISAGERAKLMAILAKLTAAAEDYG